MLVFCLLFFPIFLASPLPELFFDIDLSLEHDDYDSFIESSPSPVLLESSPSPVLLESSPSPSLIDSSDRVLAAEILLKKKHPSTAALTQLSDKRVARIMTMLLAE